MKFTKGLTSTGNIVASTPDNFFKLVSSIFNVSLDVCAINDNAKCRKYFTPEIDGLKQQWLGGGVWCNPPYGREINKWCEKAYVESRKQYNDFVLMLLPMRSDTKWWWDWVQNKAIVMPIKGRIRFNNMNSKAPFPSCLALYFKDLEGDPK